ncbi:MAG: GNAT family N-acetyltransferase [Mycoplasmatales bacterium]
MFRHALISDIDTLLDILKKVKEQMHNIDKLDQWTDNYPNKDVLLNDIKQKQLYVYLVKDIIVGFGVLNEDFYEAYNQVTWSSNQEARTIHRVCVDPKFKNNGYAYDLFLNLEKEAIKQGITYIKIDTFSKNYRMDNLLLKLDYKFLGTMDLHPGLDVWNCYEKFLSIENNIK